MNGSIEQINVRMLCDTGAVCSCMSRIYYERNLHSKTSLRKCSKAPKLMSAGGNDLTTIGHVKTKIKLGGCALPLEFCVIENLMQDVILGANFF